VRTEYALQEIPAEHLHANSERYWVRPMYGHEGPLTDLEEARARMKTLLESPFLMRRQFRLLSRTVSDWEEVK
jgi:hypothetical protein